MLPEQPAARSPEQPTPQVVACVKWAELRAEVDPLHGTVRGVNHGHGLSESDLAAVEVALRVAEQWAGRVTVVCAGPATADSTLQGLVAAGVARIVRVDLDPAVPSAEVARALASVVRDELAADLVVCGDASADRGSGSVPAYLAHELQAAQALGLVEVGVDDRRLS
ncbi:MAG: adenine nucleotide alpha hydrolase family protein, partial [Microthrixaceae bacterium]